MHHPLHTALCDLLGCEYPIMLAGMDPVSRAELTAAVCNAGGFGVLAATSLTPDQMAAEVKRLRSLTDKPFGIDLLLPARLPDAGSATEFKADIPPAHTGYVRGLYRDFSVPEAASTRGRRALTHSYVREQVEAVVELRPAVFASGLGNSKEVIDLMHSRGIIVASLVGNVKNGVRMAQAGSDIVVAQGHEAGGHTGRIGTLALVPQVADAVAPRPVVAAGGIGDGRGLVASLALGAIGVWCGSAFIPTVEGNAPRWWKQRMLEAADEDTQVTRVYSGKTMRNLRNRLTERWESDGPPALGMPLQGLLMSDFLYSAEQAGRTDLMFSPAGQITGLFKEIKPAAQVVREMVEQATALLERGLARPAAARPPLPRQG
ncbi:MAG: nitronate monooxygenase [Chloroflexi bacterium]|nr:nitronate monooxygenase [Chloroflexota bacterium]